MALELAARHVNVHRRMAVRRVTRWMGMRPAAILPGPLSSICVAVSVAVHVMVSGAALLAPQVAHPAADRDPMLASRFLYPLMKPQPKPTVERISLVGLGGPAVAAAPTRVVTGDQTLATGDGTAPQEASPAPESMPVLDLSEPFSEIEVDEAAAADPESEGPSYPDSLLAAQIEGEARVKFVVDSTGRAVLASFVVVETNEPAFGDAVRAALPRMKFRPASIGAKRVSQHVEQSFMFKISQRPPIP